MNSLYSKVTFQDWIFNVEKELTKSEYSKITESSAEICQCENCLTYITNRNKLIPQEILILFEKLGIDPNKEIEVSYMGEIDEGMQYYSGWFHFIGNFHGKDCKVSTSKNSFTIEHTRINNYFEIGFTKEKHLSQFETNKDLVQVEFACKIKKTSV